MSFQDARQAVVMLEQGYQEIVKLGEAGLGFRGWGWELSELAQSSLRSYY
jgi:hypothetical protein